MGRPLTRAYDWIAHHGRRTPGKLAAVDHASGRRLTYAELDGRVARLAGHLRSLGVKAGDRVAVLAPNSVDVFEVQFACWRLGAILNPLNWRLAPPELEFITGDSQPSVLVYDREQAELAAPLPGVKLERGGDESDYEKAVAGAEPLSQPATPDLDDVLCLLYTAGTTGRPKGALITYGMTFWNAVNIGMAVDLTARSTCLVVLPTFHTGGLNLYANPTFHVGGTVVVMRAFDPGESLRLISDPEAGVTHFFGVPANYLFMAQHPDFAAADFSRLAATGLGGAPAPLPLLETWARRGCPLMQGYGMTETSPSAIVIGGDQVIAKQGSCGLPVMHTEVRIVDQAGADVRQGEIGELWVRGPNVTPGYWRRPDADAESFTDGWLHTGDAARQDEDGYYYIVDRWKDMFISGGENVYPAEVENAIYALQGVGEAAVVGVPDERWGEVGRAFVVLKPGCTLSAEEVLEHCRRQLARFKVPKSVVFSDQPLPRNAAGKILKRELIR